jgi:hypothetical protein
MLAQLNLLSPLLCYTPQSLKLPPVQQGQEIHVADLDQTEHSLAKVQLM